MPNYENSSKLELLKDKSPEELQAEMNSVADELSSLERSIKEMQKELSENPSPQLESEIGISQFRVAELQRTLQGLLEKESGAKNESKRTDPWSDQYIGGRNGAARNK